MKTSKAISIVAVLFIMSPVTASADTFRLIDNLASVTFWESTSNPMPDAYTYSLSSTQLSTRLSGSLSRTNCDFIGVPGKEFYDVFYSDADGTFNLDGEYLTIEGTFSLQSPYGGGLNIAEMGLNFNNGHTEYANYVASFVALGNNAIQDSVKYAIDGNLLTWTTLGNTVGQTQRLRLTLGFLSSSGPAPQASPVPVPPSVVLLGSGLVGIIGIRRRLYQ